MNKSPFIDTDIKNPKTVIGRQTRVALFGGTFDPLTDAHLFIGQKIQEWLNLDKFYFVPCVNPYHKSDSQTITDFEIRYEMVQLALSNMPSSSLSVLKYKEPEITKYSINTVNKFLEEYPDSEGELFFVVGSDSYYDLVNWKDYKTLLKLVNLIVIKRYGKKEVDQISDNVIVVGIPSISGISSTKIRKLVAKKQPIDHLVPAAVKEFIIKNNLYLKED